ncbi:MAG: DUF1289 domain-containing protein [Burkholderiales bacterium]
MDLRRARKRACYQSRPGDRGKKSEGRLTASPCNKVCVMNEVTGLCRGCYRTLDEIARWGTMSDAEREGVMEKLPKRAAPTPGYTGRGEAST